MAHALGILPGGEARARNLRERIRDRLRAQRETGGEDREIGGIPCVTWRPAPKSSTPAPLVIFSHGFHGTPRQSGFLMSALAAEGYVVIAPRHRDAIGGGENTLGTPPESSFGHPQEWTDETFADRSRDIHHIVESLVTDRTWSIDWNRLALAGHSLGGYTVLGLAGGWRRWKLPGAKAVLALSPYAHPFSTQERIRDIDVPVMYQSGTLDLGILPALTRSGGVWDQTRSHCYLISFERAGHFAFTDVNHRFQDSIKHYTLAFLDECLGRKSIREASRKRHDVADLRIK